MVKRVLPDRGVRALRAVLGLWQRLWGAVRTMRSARQRQSAEDVFTAVYRQNVWGGAPGEFNSGGGSDERLAAPYCRAVRDFLAERFPPDVRIVDLGCGDFRVGKALLTPTMRYVGVDVVRELIAHNERINSSDRVSFVQADAVEDALPDGDVCLVRQVFQHLSNAQIVRVLGRLEKYRQVIVTEHYFTEDAAVVPNVDKPHGADTRLERGSSVYLDRRPFGLDGLHHMLTVPLDAHTELRTFRFEASPTPSAARAAGQPS